MAIPLQLERRRSKPVAFLTGTTGQDGSYLSELLLEKGYSVIGMVRRASTDNTERLYGFRENENFKLVEGDVADAHCMSTLIQKYKPDEFYNLAAQSHVGTSFEQPEFTFRVNALGVINCLEAIRKYSPETRFYQASTSEMFGKNYDKTGDHMGFQNEETRFSPQSPYAIAKVAGHNAVEMYRDAYGLHASAGILFNHESPRRGENFVTRKITKYIGDFKAWMADNQIVDYDDSFISHSKDHIIMRSHFNSSVELKYPKLRLGNLDAFRDWGFAWDYVKAMWLMLQQDNADDYVICTGETRTVREFVNIAFSYIGVKDIKECVCIDPKFYRPADVEYLKGCPHKANNKLGWTAQTSFHDLVRTMVIHDIKKANPTLPLSEIHTTSRR